ncbi:MAG TPA: ComEC/Rec2 family competence protein, partial [Chthoniobacteraceae bacterium]|nr:ComEC/Rec2 family competence protein [Chthoniobacteraceae bacterium]
QLHLEAVEIDGHTSPADAVVLAKWVGDTPAYGDRVSITGEMDDIPAPRNPGQFDYAAYMHRLGIYSEISMLDAASGEVLDGGHGNPLVALALNTRHWVQQKLQVDLEDSPNVSGLVQSLTLGLKNETPEETRELFQRTGTLHLFVVNGLHIGMFTTIMFLLVRLFGAGRVLSVLIVAPLVCFYALLTGSSTGSVRATVMTLIILGGMLADGKPAMMNNLAAAGLAILAWNTNELLMPGFQFSFGVVFTIILLAGPLQNYFAKFGKPDEFLPRALWNRRQRALNYCSWNVAAMLGVSISATLGSLPFAASYFDLLTPSALAANLVVVPMAFLILTQSILSAVGGIFSTSLSAVFNNVNWVIANMVLATVRFFSQFPGGHFYVEMPPFQSKPACEITVLDLGDGGAVHVRSQARDWLLDCGNTGPYESTVRNYLHSRGVNRLDCFVVTHGNSKFIGGAKSVEEDFTPVVSADSPLDDRSPVRRAYHDWLSANALTRANWKRGDALDVSVVAKIRVLYPPPDSAARLADDKTLVMRLECGGCRVLFMSGAGAFTEQWLHDNEPDLR